MTKTRKAQIITSRAVWICGVIAAILAVQPVVASNMAAHFVMFMPQKAFASSVFLVDESRCTGSFLNGSWDSTTNTCTVSGFTLNSGDFLSVEAGVTLRNTGDIGINGGGRLLNHGTILNEGTLDDFGLMENRGGATIVNTGTIRIHDDFDITLNQGTIRNFGTYENLNGLIDNFGTYDNFGTIRNQDTFRHWNTLINQAGGTFDNTGGSHFDNLHRIDNFGTFIVSGRFENEGGNLDNGFGSNLIIHDSGTIHNNLDGRINLFFSSAATNSGTINNNDGRILNGATISNPGSINNHDVFENFCATITGNPVNGNMPSFTPCAPAVTSEVLPPGPLFPQLHDFPPSTPGLYSTSTPTISGTSNVLSGGGSELTITVYELSLLPDPVVVGTAIDSGEGWSITTSPLSYGLHRLLVTATNSQGNTGFSAAFLIGTTVIEIKDAATCESPLSGVWDSSANTCTFGFLTERTDDVLQVDSGVTAVFNGFANFDGTINNHGTFRNAGSLGNFGALNNFGVLVATSDEFDPFFGDRLISAGTMNNENGATLTVENSGLVINTGTLNNRGTINIADSDSTIEMHPSSNLNNFATINNNGMLDNRFHGTITLFCGGTITGNPVIGGAPIELPCPPVITSSGPFGTTTPTIIGTSEPGGAISLFVLSGGLLTPIGSTTASPSGTWSITTSPLSIGTHTLAATASNSAGVSELSDPVDIVVDNISPTVTGTADRAPDSNGWYNHEVTITWSGADAGSGIVSCDPPTAYSGPDGGSITLTGQCTDNAGNIGEGAVTFNYDATAPTITGTLNVATPVSGWYRTDVTALFTASDATSGIKAFSSAIELDSEGADQSAEGFAEDNAGNIAFFTIDGINIDKTPPEITITRTPANENGWNNGDVTVHFEATDATSGIQGDSFFDVFFTLEGASQTTGLVTFTDLAGNSASEEVSDINIDRTAPEVTGNPTEPPNENGWYNEDVTIEFSATDALSGIDGLDNAIEVISDEGDSQSASHAFTDLAGNSATGIVEDIKLDKTAPDLAVPDDVEVFPVSPDGAAVDFEAEATDNLDPNPEIEYSMEPGSTFTIGTTTVQVTATDQAGNSATDSFSITVLAPEEATEEMMEIVEDMELPQDIEGGLSDKLEAATDSIEQGKVKPAQNQLKAFINQVEAQAGKSITEEQAEMLIAAAQDIINSIS